MPVLSSFTSSPSNMFILLRFCVVLATTLVSTVHSVESESQAMMYLSKYGYLSPAVRNPRSGQIISEDSFSKALQEFQAFAGLNITGVLDKDTRELMNMPRCGVKDRVRNATSSRSKRYAHFGRPWSRRNLTYKISKYPWALANAETDKAVKEAFGVWTSVTPFTFTQKKNGPVDIEIRFVRGYHGACNPFGPHSKEHAHADVGSAEGFSPNAVHFDDEVKWTVDSSEGTNLLQVAVHEFGHTLGLDHSEKRSSAMYFQLQGYNPSFELDPDDIAGIQALYGMRRYSKGSGGNPTTNESSDESEDTELCNDVTIDTIFNFEESVSYAFKANRPSDKRDANKTESTALHSSATAPAVA